MKRRWRQEKTKEWSNLNVFSKLLFFDIYQKNQDIHFLVHGHSSWFTFGLHLVRDPKASWIVLFFKKKKKSDHGKRPSSMVRLHRPWCKPALNYGYLDVGLEVWRQHIGFDGVCYWEHFHPIPTVSVQSWTLQSLNPFSLNTCQRMCLLNMLIS